MVDLVINCRHCRSTNTALVDNEPLYHPTKKDIGDGITRYDTEIYVTISCFDCNSKTGRVFDMVLRKTAQEIKQDKVKKYLAKI